jgi:hypothetical protein
MSPPQNTVKSLAERRVRRQKIFIAAGSVVLLGVLGFQLPKLLGGNDGQKQLEQALSTALDGVTAPAASPVVPAGQLPGDVVVVRRDSNQLISFGLFKSKDPFVQQLTSTASDTPATPPASAPPAATTPKTSIEPAPPVVVPLGPPSTPTVPSGPSTVPDTTTPAAPTAPAPVPTEALLATNDICERVSVKGTFPATENIFRLVSIAKNGKSVQLGIVGGSFDSGQPTATLKLGDKLTLVNTADGTRYVIELKAKCAGLETQPVGAPATTTTATQPIPTTPVAPAPAPTTTTTTTTDTVTTPIVTDADDTTPPSS